MNFREMEGLRGAKNRLKARELKFLLMDQRIERLAFCFQGEEPFRLETRYHADDPELRHRRLFHGNREVKVEPRQLDLLAFLLSRPKTPLSEKELADRIWGRDSVSGGNVEQQIYKLRQALGEKAGSPRFIETIPKFGYKFLLEVKVERTFESNATASSTSLQILERWEHERFYRFIKETIRGEDNDEDGDLRILTTAFSSGVPDVIPDLLEKNVRIKILMANEALVRARNKVRREHTPEKALLLQNDQRETLATWKKLSTCGALDVRETDVMPYGIVLHSRMGALIGLFIATESYVRGPMIVVGTSSRLWETLLMDWRRLWRDTEQSVSSSEGSS
jgi:DNA-binding winged helix-turn-helix (wHTH) protein